MQNCKKNLKCGLPVLNDGTDATCKNKVFNKQPKATINYVPKKNEKGKTIVVGLAQDTIVASDVDKCLARMKLSQTSKD